MLNAPELLRRLKEANVEFIVIGGLAMITHGSAHVTEDIDICYSRAEANLEALSTALAPIHPYLRGAPPGLPFRLDAATIRAGLNFTLTTDLGAIDLFAEVTGLGAYEKMTSLAEPFSIFGLSVQVLSLDALMIAKKAAGRTKDAAHLIELEELKKLKAGPGPHGS